MPEDKGCVRPPLGFYPLVLPLKPCSYLAKARMPDKKGCGLAAKPRLNAAEVMMPDEKGCVSTQNLGNYLSPKSVKVVTF